MHDKPPSTRYWTESLDSKLAQAQSSRNWLDSGVAYHNNWWSGYNPSVWGCQCLSCVISKKQLPGSVHQFEDAETLGTTYTFEKAFDVGVDNLESLGVLGQLFFYFF